VGTRELLEQARKLDPTERLELVDGLLQSLDRPDPVINAVWLEEAERRLAAYRAGKVRGVSGGGYLRDDLKPRGKTAYASSRIVKRTPTRCHCSASSSSR
jgi:putative addiction module component (TIGR02574 family)